jgi:hypothetical protein
MKIHRLTPRAGLAYYGRSLKCTSSTPTPCCEVGFFTPLIQELRTRAISSVMGVSGHRKVPAALVRCESTPTLIGGFSISKAPGGHHA